MSIPRSTRTAEYRVLQALGENCGVIVSDPSSGECVFRFRSDWDQFAGGEAEVLAALAFEMPERCREMGVGAFLAWVDETLSNTFRAEPPRAAIYVDLDRTAQTLYRRYVQSTVRKFETHLPLIPIDLAAGGLGEDRARGAEAWIEAQVPGRRRLSDDLFVVRVHGRSMEPDIPDGSLCVFRAYYGGSRRGGIFIVQRMATLDDGGEFTLKRYDSSKTVTADGWRHDRIKMQPGNPEYKAWELDDEDRWVTVAQFIAVLEDPPA
jgi:SOS-response transcriptional repressor LexA